MPEDAHPNLNPLRRLWERARRIGARIVLPEGTEPRVLHAARTITDEKIARVILLGDETAVGAAAAAAGVSLHDIGVIDPARSELLEAYAAALNRHDPKRFAHLDAARRQMTQVLWYGAMMVRSGDADGMVAGAVHTTIEVLHPALRVVGAAPGVRTVSGYSLMVVPRYRDTRYKSFVFADTGVIPTPDATQLADIAVSAADACRMLLGDEPRVAFLSFSTKGSARHPQISKLAKALSIVRNMRPDMICDAELQLDAAIVPEVARLKDPDGVLAGDANVLIFPDLNSGNIAYKIVERLVGAQAVGPLISGLDKPINDLSRGCSAEDIVNAAAVTAVTSRPDS